MLLGAQMVQRLLAWSRHAHHEPLSVSSDCWRATVQALDVIQKGKRVAAASSQSCAEFDSLEVRLPTVLRGKYVSNLAGNTLTSRIFSAGQDQSGHGSA